LNIPGSPDRVLWECPHVYNPVYEYRRKCRAHGPSNLRRLLVKLDPWHLAGVLVDHQFITSLHVAPEAWDLVSRRPHPHLRPLPTEAVDPSSQTSRQASGEVHRASRHSPAPSLFSRLQVFFAFYRKTMLLSNGIILSLISLLFCFDIEVYAIPVFFGKARSHVAFKRGTNIDPSRPLGLLPTASTGHYCTVLFSRRLVDAVSHFISIISMVSSGDSLVTGCTFPSQELREKLLHHGLGVASCHMAWGTLHTTPHSIYRSTAHDGFMI
jgi:hypothetical protein